MSIKKAVSFESAGEQRTYLDLPKGMMSVPEVDFDAAALTQQLKRAALKFDVKSFRPCDLMELARLLIDNYKPQYWSHLSAMTDEDLRNEVRSAGSWHLGFIRKCNERVVSMLQRNVTFDIRDFNLGDLTEDELNERMNTHAAFHDAKERISAWVEAEESRRAKAPRKRRTGSKGNIEW